MSILIVDDHPSCRAAFRAVLENDGFAVIGEAGDGASAVAAAQKLQPEVVLLDVQLPDTDGFAVAAELTKNGSGPQIVLTSSRDADDFGPLIAESGARGFIPKAEVSADRVTSLLQ
jgi:DNA-binding NarL/FixJ family response regulator